MTAKPTIILPGDVRPMVTQFCSVLVSLGCRNESAKMGAVR